jgi:hypothetical protein
VAQQQDRGERVAVKAPAPDSLGERSFARKIECEESGSGSKRRGAGVARGRGVVRRSEEQEPPSRSK